MAKKVEKIEFYPVEFEGKNPQEITAQIMSGIEYAVQNKKTYVCIKTYIRCEHFSQYNLIIDEIFAGLQAADYFVQILTMTDKEYPDDIMLIFNIKWEAMYASL